MHLKRRYRWPQNVFALDALKEFKWQRRLEEKSSFQCIVYKTNKKNIMKYQLNTNVSDWICLKFN